MSLQIANDAPEDTHCENCAEKLFPGAGFLHGFGSYWCLKPQCLQIGLRTIRQLIEQVNRVH